jgi:hypothetical protein
VKFAIDQAHARGLEFHAYINPCPVTDEKAGPPQPDHIWQKHCTIKSNPNWVVFQGGRPAPFNEYYWFNPNLPEVQTYIRQVVVDFASRYEADGIHFDRIRFPSNNVSDDPWSKARFKGAGNPMAMEYNEWQRENLTRMLTDIYGAVTAIKPKMKFSAAVWGIYDNRRLPGYGWTSSGLQNYHQDSMAWINRGCMDALIPMIYWNIGDRKPDYDELLADFQNHVSNGRHIYGGQMVFDQQEMMRQIVATNLIGSPGTCPFTLGKIKEVGMLPFYRANIFPNDVPTAPMPWKEQPTKGMIHVSVQNAQGSPVMDAAVKMPGSKYVWLSSADGFCAILDVEPGPGKTLTAEKASASASAQPFAVVAGKATPVKLVLK